MKTNDFAYYIQKFFVQYMPDEIGASINTLASYRDSYILLLRFLKERYEMPAEKVAIKDLTRDKVMAFLDWLEKERSCSVYTRNNRLAAIHSFIKYLQYEYPDYAEEYIKILRIPFKKGKRTEMAWLPPEAIKELFNQCDTLSTKGYRDYFMLYLMYETGIRVSEVLNIQIKDFRKTKPYHLKVLGKGNKERLIPLQEFVIDKLKKYLELNGWLDGPETHLLFVNPSGGQLTRQGVACVLKKYVEKARKSKPELFPNKISPHTLRHSKAMHLVQQDVNLIYIRDLLGHESIVTTQVYARADSKRKYDAIVGAYQELVTKEEPEWHNSSTLAFLESFLKK